MALEDHLRIRDDAPHHRPRIGVGGRIVRRVIASPGHVEALAGRKLTPDENSNDARTALLVKVQVAARESDRITKRDGLAVAHRDREVIVSVVRGFTPDELRDPEPEWRIRIGHFPSSARKAPRACPPRAPR